MKRRLFTILLFLLFGAVLNVAVALACVLWTPSVPGLPPYEDLPAGSRWPRRVPSNWPAPTQLTIKSSFGKSFVGTLGPVDPDSVEAQDGVAGYGQSLFQWGWPCRSMESEARTTSRHRGERFRSEWIADAGTVPRWMVPFDNQGRRIPLRPIPLGFLANTVLFGLLLWLFWLVMRRYSRREIRRRRGCCLKCGYDLRGDYERGCPECGWNRQDAPV